MGLTDALRKLDQKYPSSFLGLVVGIIIGVFGIYLTLFYEKKPDILFSVLSNFRVYDIRENIGSLQINFEGENIKEKGLTLSLITLKIINNSKVDILKAYYDEKNPLGVQVDASRIIRYDVVATSNQYLHDTLKVTQIGEAVLNFTPVILESEQFFTLKVLVLHPEHSVPQVLPVGKIAGIQQFKVIEEPKSQTKKSIWYDAYNGEIVVQIVRVIIYGIGTLLALISLGILTAVTSDWLSSTKRKRFVKHFKKMKDRDFNDKENKIFDRYINLGEDFIVKIERILLSKDMLKRELAAAKRSKGEYRDITMMPMHFYPGFSGNFLIDNEIANIRDGDVICDQEAVDTVKQFVMFLSAHIPEKIKQAKRKFALQKNIKKAANERVESD